MIDGRVKTVIYATIHVLTILNMDSVRITRRYFT